MVSTLYGIWTAVVMCVSIVFLHYLQRKQAQFYQAYKMQIIGSVTLLVVPLLLRSVLDWMGTLNAWHQLVYSSTNSLTVYNLLFFLLGTYTIIIAQTASLIFGVLRQRI